MFCQTQTRTVIMNMSEEGEIQRKIL